MPLDGAVGLGEHLDDLFLVRDGDAQAPDAQAGASSMNWARSSRGTRKGM